MQAYAREAGRDPAAIAIEGRVSLVSQEPQDWLAQMQAWKTLGVPISRSEPTEVRSARRRSTSSFTAVKRLWPRESRICRDNSVHDGGGSYPQPDWLIDRQRWGVAWSHGCRHASCGASG